MRLRHRRRPDRSIQQAGGGRQAASEHLLAERHQPVGAAVCGRLRDEAAAARLARHEAVVGQLLHGVAGSHPADPELCLHRSASDGSGSPGRNPAIRSRRACSIRRYCGVKSGLGHALPSGLRTVDRRPDRSGHRPELGRHDLDRGQVGRPHAATELGSDRLEQEVAGGRHAAADDDAVRGHDDDHVGDADAEPAARSRPDRPGPGRRRPGAAATAASGVSVPQAAANRSARANASRQPRLPQPHTGPSASSVWWPTSPAVPSWPRTTRPSIAITPPTPVPSVSPTIEPHAAARPGAELGQAERPRIVDQGGGHAEGCRERGCDRPAGPVARHVDEEPGRAGRRVVQTGHTDAQRGDRPVSLERRGSRGDESPDHGVGPIDGVRRRSGRGRSSARSRRRVRRRPI